MTLFSVAQSFIDEAARENTLEGLNDRFMAVIQSMGFDTFTCLSCCPDINKAPPGAVYLNNFKPEWTEQYNKEKYYLCDPTFHHALKTALPFTWDDPAVSKNRSKRQHKLFDEARDAGIGYGITVSVRSPMTVPATVNVVSEKGNVDPQAISAIHLMSIYLHNAAKRISLKDTETREVRVSNLTPRERECIRWVADGKTDWEIGEIVGISENTAHFHVENAKKKFGVATRQQAVVEALMSAQIAMG